MDKLIALLLKGYGAIFNMNQADLPPKTKPRGMPGVLLK